MCRRRSLDQLCRSKLIMGNLFIRNLCAFLCKYPTYQNFHPSIHNRLRLGLVLLIVQLFILLSYYYSVVIYLTSFIISLNERSPKTINEQCKWKATCRVIHTNRTATLVPHTRFSPAKRLPLCIHIE